ncbi:MAG: type II toxin-antitoxin system VapC family toxin [Nitrospinota bacterium]
MSVRVVDACVAAKWFIDEDHAEEALNLLSEKYTLHAPDFLLLELDSVFCKWVRRGTIAFTEGNELRAAFKQYPIRLHSFIPLLDSAFIIANQTSCSLYDSVYIALAVLLDGKLITADRRLYDSALTGGLKKTVAWVEEIG